MTAASRYAWSRSGSIRRENASGSPSTARTRTWGRCSISAADIVAADWMRVRRLRLQPRLGFCASHRTWSAGSAARPRTGGPNPEAAPRVLRGLSPASVLPAELRRAVVTVVARPFGGDLEVLAELLVARLGPEGQDVFAQLVPVKVEGESVEEQRLWYQVMQRQDADLLEEMCQEHVVVWLELLLEQTPERRRRGPAMERVDDGDEGLGVLGRNAPEVGGGRPGICGTSHRLQR